MKITFELTEHEAQALAYLVEEQGREPGEFFAESLRSFVCDSPCIDRDNPFEAHRARKSRRRLPECSKAAPCLIHQALAHSQETFRAVYDVYQDTLDLAATRRELESRTKTPAPAKRRAQAAVVAA